MEGNSLLPLSQFSYPRSLGTCKALFTLSQHIQIALDMFIEGRNVQLKFSVIYDRISRRDILYKLWSIGPSAKEIFSDVGDYRPIFITPILSNVF